MDTGGKTLTQLTLLETKYHSYTPRWMGREAYFLLRNEVLPRTRLLCLGLQKVSAVGNELSAKGQGKLTACSSSANLSKFSAPSESHLQPAPNLSYNNINLHKVCLEGIHLPEFGWQDKQELPVKGEETWLSSLPTVDLPVKGWGFRPKDAYVHLWCHLEWAIAFSQN